LQLSQDKSSGSAFRMTAPANIELTDSDGQQSWMYLEPKVLQTGTAAFNALHININGTVEDTYGDGSTADHAQPSTFINCEEGGVGMYNISYKTTIEEHDTSTLFDASATTDTATVWTQPAESILLACKIVLEEQFVATSLTDLEIQIGITGDDDNGLIVEEGNMTSDAVGTVYNVRGEYWSDAEQIGYHAASARAWHAKCDATGADLDTLTAGRVRIYFTYLKY